MRYLMILAVISVPACAPPNYSERWPHSLMISGGPQVGFAIKQVVNKESPQTLLADDGSVCRTSGDRFKRTRLGKWIACSWSYPTLDSNHVAIAESEQ
jgi:hypothetical protein